MSITDRNTDIMSCKVSAQSADIIFYRKDSLLFKKIKIHVNCTTIHSYFHVYKLSGACLSDGASLKVFWQSFMLVLWQLDYCRDKG